MSDISIRKGNHKDVPFQVKDGATILSLAGATVELMVKEDLADIDSAAKITKISSEAAEMTIDSEALGKFTVHFIPTDTSTLDAGNYFYDIRIITSGSKEYNTEREGFAILDVVNRL